ncbi:MAG: hypothetical protein HY872_02010 [Chloroflexi bacterium]|nr:hypothetical protein [Chloroflexota bacterium]
MSVQAQSRAAKWGWGILIALSAFLALNGVGLYFLSASPAIFEQDTGVPMAEVSRTYPTVADQVVREGQNISILLTGFGLLALAVALEGFRHGSRWVWNSTWVLVAWLVVGAFQALVVSGRLAFGGFYLAFAVIALVGQLLARRGLAS